MAVNNGSAILECKQQQTSTEKDWWYSHYRQLAHYLGLLCFLLTIAALFQTLCLAQITLVFRSQSTLQEARLKDLTHKLDKLNQSHRLLFSQYPALNQYCPLTNATTNERECRPCLANWTSRGESCYLFSRDRADWISSQYHCMAAGGALVRVNSEEEQIFLWNQAKTLSHGDSYWVGLRSSGADGGWQWSDGSPLDQGPQFWESEPDKGDSRELCARISPGENYRTDWVNSRCSNHLRRICERRQASLQ
ncbi:C-type lectin domain family 4 member E-like [Centroberyx affinis]|uniref:C-type lectin domain family 4 member E-like n=1 Tax=Centroberyx affinis TaxID=166261 RepID=UPI003A5BC68E